LRKVEFHMTGEKEEHVKRRNIEKVSCGVAALALEMPGIGKEFEIKRFPIK